MSDTLSVRSAESDDAERVREIAESTFTQAYALSPQDIETILSTKFDVESLRTQFEEDDESTLVAEQDGVLTGFAMTSADEGTIRWLHVDPERRGVGVGTTLFEQAVEELEAEGVEDVRGIVLSSNTAAGAFFERFGYGQTDEWQTDIGGLEVVEYAFAESSDVESGDDARDTEHTDSDWPDTTTTDDGQTVHLDDDVLQGTEGAFVAAYTDEDRTEEYGYYCTNCGSTDVSMDSMERLECENCGNVRRPDDDYDESYL